MRQVKTVVSYLCYTIGGLIIGAVLGFSVSGFASLAGL